MRRPALPLFAFVCLLSACTTGETDEGRFTGFTTNPTTVGEGDGDGDSGETGTDGVGDGDGDGDTAGVNCGDGVVDPGEECDLGPGNGADAQCTPVCQIAECGDGYHFSQVEDCDDGNTDNTDACVTGCNLASCGDGFVQTDVEVCDDGNDDETDGCNSMCMLGTCGDGVVQAGEQCDDNNLIDTDNCPSTCQFAYCGDGFLQAGLESCDDGNMINTDACLNLCTPAICGDGVVQEGVEDCDDNNMVDTDACTMSCGVNVCGDGILYEGVEDCDDGNMIDNDGCAPDCTSLCANPGGGNLTAENGTGMNTTYCYNQGDSLEVRAQKACESHFGVGQCCVIMGGYSSLQYGQCNGGGGDGSIHWHPDAHPNGHCGPIYVPGDVIAPGWCGVILGSFTD